jgi:hypothetical protein
MLCKDAVKVCDTTGDDKRNTVRTKKLTNTVDLAKIQKATEAAFSIL